MSQADDNSAWGKLASDVEARLLEFALEHLLDGEGGQGR